MVGVAFICCTFVAKIKCHLSYELFKLFVTETRLLETFQYQCSAFSAYNAVTKK